MSVISDISILEKIYKKDLAIDPFISDHLQPASIDLCLGNSLKLPKEEIEVPPVYSNEEIENWFETIEIKEEFIIRPGQFVLAQVREKIALPNNITGHIQNRNSLIRLGINVGLSSYINPGYSGKLPIAIHNLGEFNFKLVPGIRICQLILSETFTETKGYGFRTETKYQNESDITLSKLPADKELSEYMALKTKNKTSLASFLKRKIKNDSQSIMEILSDEEKKQLGLL